MEIFEYISQYINTDIQFVINEMYSDGCAPQLIHDTVQLLKLKGTVEELKKNPDEWIRKHQVETDDPFTLEQIHNLLRLSQDSFNEEFFKKIKNSGYFPKKFLFNYSYLYNSNGILQLNICLSDEQEALLLNKIDLYDTMSKPNLFIMIGIPASGKSTLSENMSTVAFYLPMDDWRRFYFDSNMPIGLKHNILPEYNTLIKKVLMQGKNVILDGIFTSHKYRNHAISKYSELSNITIIYMDIPLKQCLYRNEHRPYTVLPAEIEKMYKELEPPTLGADAADAIITNRYDETSKSYTVSVQCKESVDKDLIDTVTVAITNLNKQQQILSNVHQYDGMEIQSVINEMYSDGCAPQLIHDTVQLLKLKDTVEEFNQSVLNWISINAIGDDPLSKKQYLNLLSIWDNYLHLTEKSQNELDFLLKNSWFPEDIPVTYSIESNNSIFEIVPHLNNDRINEYLNQIKVCKTSDQPLIILMVGCPGSGKSTISKQLSTSNNYFRISHDEFASSFWGTKMGHYTLNINKEYNRIIDLCIQNKKNIIIDNTHTYFQNRNYYTNKYKSSAKVIILYMDVSLSECIKRNSIREEALSETYIQEHYREIDLPTLDSDAADAIITNHYDETSKSYTVSVQCKESVDKGLVDTVTTAINTLNKQQQILSNVHQYDGMEIQSVINEMYENHCAPQLIHDTVQLLKLKDTVEELKKNPDEWIRKYQVETDDPLSLKQLHGLLLLQDNYNDTLYDTLENSGYFPETLPLSYTVEIITCKRVQNNEIINNAGDIIIHTQLSSSLKNNIQHKITSFKTADDPMLILLSGYPASGKTTLAHILEDKEIGINFEMDEWITKSLNCTHVIGTRLIVKEYNRLIREAIDKGINVIINNVNSTVTTRRNNILTYKKNKTVILFQDVSKDICLIRNCNREKVLPDVVINQIIDEFEPPSLATDNVNAIITNRYDEDADSYIVSVESRDETFKEELKKIAEIMEQAINQ